MKQEALSYQESCWPGKFAIRPSKPMANKRDLALAYSPGVAKACRAISRHPVDAARYTVRGNLMAVVSNGSLVLGLGNIGALAAKPVMEGKAVLFKKFANIDVFDIEVDEADQYALADTIRRLEPTFVAVLPNQVNNVLCFPFIFRGTLDVGATEINSEMKLACVSALAELARSDSTDEAVRAAMESCVATRPFDDLEAYRASLSRFVYRSSFLIRPLFDVARTAPSWLIFAEGGADFEFEGEMQLNLAFDKVARDSLLPCARLTDRASILVFSGMDAANAAIDALTTLANAEPIGPMLLGLGGAVHVVTPDSALGISVQLGGIRSRPYGSARGPHPSQKGRN